MSSAAPVPVVIAGGGAAGTALAVRLLQARPAPAVVLVDPAPAPGRGLAYATASPAHLLNVRAGGMSLVAESPGDFTDWLRADGEPDSADAPLQARFVPRHRYGDYLQDRLAQAIAQAPGRFTHHRARVAAAWRDGDGGLQVRLDDGTVLAAAALALAPGNAARPLPARGAGSLPPGRRIEAWEWAALEDIAADAPVCIVGTGLTALDVLASLQARGHHAPVHLLGRHGRLPLAHTATPAPPVALDIDALCALPLRARMHAVRARVRQAAREAVPWQDVMDGLRAHVQRLWRSLEAADQRRFLRHAVRWWDIHRHRIAPQMAAVLEQARAAGRLHVHRARLETVHAHGTCVQVRARTRDGGACVLEVAHIVNATGVELRVPAMRNALLDELLGQGLAVPGPHGIGIDSDPAGRVIATDGRAQDDLYVLGSLRIGTLWESLAMPELRVQAAEVAAAIAGHLDIEPAR